MDIEMFGKLSDAFGPSGFEEDVDAKIQNTKLSGDVSVENKLETDCWMDIATAHCFVVY